METFSNFERTINGIVWGGPMIVLLMGTGLVLTILTRGVQFRYLGFAMKEVLGKLTQKSTGEGDVTPFQAVATALASTVGVGNIAGVATAITLGGPGAVFWLWMSGILGMCTKYAEIVIALNYREKDSTGTMRGGAMYSLRKGLNLGWLGTIFAVLVSIAAFGSGNTVQANSLAQIMETSFGVAPWITGLSLATVTGAVILGGIKRIGEVTQVLVPFMCILYLGGGLLIVLLNIGELPNAIGLIFTGAMSGTAAAGGFAGASVSLALRYGVARGLFSNEAGLGSAPLVHAAAVTDHPVRQGMYGIFEVMVDTVLVCTLTALAILVTGTWTGGETGAALSAQAFTAGLPGGFGGFIVTGGVLLFAFSTLVGWSYYGETAIVYLLGARAALPYRIVWLVAIYVGSVSSLEVIWNVADTMNGLMAFPNLVAVLGLIPVLLKLQKEFFAREKAAKA